MGDTETQAARLLVTLETKVGPALVKVQTYRNPDLTQANPRLTPGLPQGLQHFRSEEAKHAVCETIYSMREEDDCSAMKS